MEYLDGVDDLAEHLRDFRPGPERRVGVLVDHLVPGLQGEPDRRSRCAKSPVGKHVLIVGHPFIDIWAGGEARAARHRRRGRRSRAASSGRRASASSSAGRTATRPTSPAPGSTSSAAVRSYADLEPALLGRVEELIDFVTGQP